MPYANPIDKKIYDMGYGEKNKKRLQESRKKYYQRDETKQRRKINYKKYKDKWMELWVTLLFETDRDIKTGRKQAGIAIEMLLVSLLI